MNTSIQQLKEALRVVRTVPVSAEREAALRALGNLLATLDRADTLVCRRCGRRFAFSAGEAQFFESKHFAKPKQCKQCKAVSKAARDAYVGPIAEADGEK